MANYSAAGETVIEDKNSARSEVNLPVELGAQIEIQIPGENVRYKAYSLGMDKGHFLLIKPLVVAKGDTFETKLTKGTQLVVRYFHEGALYGFSSEILETVQISRKVFFLKYPESVEKHNLRSTRRVECLLPAKLRADYNVIDSTVVDISTTGCKSKVRASSVNDIKIFSTCTTLELKLRLPGYDDEFILNCEIKHFVKSSDVYELGILFNRLPVKVVEAIKEFVKHSFH
ncbi:flagellar brake protein [Candidatus Magnetomonas plexicatena]|uniref:flagellar brake protein n=1 Tax=Candidatus Magnetomonas plexicatena TaxID=2552947 RepID=UPI0011004666|nr:flagellar brake protein [Nitrospirales bacterium LBB_01]